MVFIYLKTLLTGLGLDFIFQLNNGEIYYYHFGYNIKKVKTCDSF
jgi:hypothetical protein